MFRKYDPYFSVTNELPVITTPATPRRLTRREIVQSLLVGTGALAAWSQVASAHPIFTHLSDAETLAKADAKAAAAKWAPEFLASHQNQTLVLLSERIVPGSSRAQVNRIIDLLLTVDTAENRGKFANSLSAIDVESRKRFGHLFKSLSTDQQEEILTSLAAGRPSVDQGSGQSIKKRLQQPALAPRDHFENVKAWIVGTYYSSEVGMRELGWTGDVYFVELPTCPHPEGHE